jgi:hypothetical protein
MQAKQLSDAIALYKSESTTKMDTIVNNNGLTVGYTSKLAELQKDFSGIFDRSEVRKHINSNKVIRQKGASNE